jgi:hypothetical protein
LTEKDLQPVEVISSAALTPQEKALLQFGQDLYTKSVDIIKDFAKVMITLVSGLFATYFAILKFLGADNVTNPKVEAIIGLAGTPPLFFGLSIIAFVMTVLPLYGKMSLNEPGSIKHARKTALYSKYGTVLVGTALFMIGMATMGWISIKLLLG